MKGLLLKDWFVLWKQGRWMLLLALLYSVISVVGDNLFFAGFTILFLSMLPLTALGFDERSHWDRYALTMPYTRRQLVLSKYLLAAIGMGAAVVWYLLLTAATLVFSSEQMNVAGFLWMLGTMLGIGLLFTALCFPIVFRLGSEKGRLWFMLITVGLIVLIGLWNFLVDETRPTTELFGTLAASVTGLLPRGVRIYAAFPFVSLALFLLSMPLSVRLYETREL